MSFPNNRIIWIDISKGLGIILVVLGHTSLSKISQISYDWIYSFHMPLFYLLSGLCFNNNKYNNFRIYIKRRFKTLILPFFILNTSIFIWGYYAQIPNLTINKTDLLTGVSALYFIRVLFISELWNLTFRKLVPDKLLFFMTITAISIIGNKLIQNNEFIIKYLLPDIATIYYALGNMLRGKLGNYQKSNIQYYLLAIIFSLSFSLLFLYSLNDVSAIILAISGITTLIAISLILTRFKAIITAPLIYIGQNTLIILALHPLIYNNLKLVTSIFIPNNITDSLIRMIITWVLLFVSIWISNKYVPWAVGKNKAISGNNL